MHGSHLDAEAEEELVQASLPAAAAFPARAWSSLEATAALPAWAWSSRQSVVPGALGGTLDRSLLPEQEAPAPVEGDLLVFFEGCTGEAWHKRSLKQMRWNQSRDRQKARSRADPNSNKKDG